MSDQAKLVLENQEVILPMLTGTENERGIDIAKLRSETGMITLDQGYGSTGSCTSSITFLDGEQGILRYRGYNIQDLAENSNFIETSYLLIHGDLPSQAEYDDFNNDTRSFTKT